jgi:hypothetical protein
MEVFKMYMGKNEVWGGNVEILACYFNFKTSVRIYFGITGFFDFVRRLVF